MFTDPQDGEMNIELPIKAAVSEAIRKSGKKRSQIVMELFNLTQIEVSQHTLNNWTAESRAKSYEGEDFNGNRRQGIPADMIPTICEITGDNTPLRIQCEKLGLTLLEGDDLIHAKIGEMKDMKTQLNQMIKTFTRIVKRGG